MIAEALAFLARINLTIACAVLLVLALRIPIRTLFGARVGYLLWWALPAAMLATLLPARTVEMVVETAPPTTVAMSSTTANTISFQAISSIDGSSILFVIWIVGCVAMLLALTTRQRRFIASLGELQRDAGGMLSSSAPGVSPLILGALRPKLVLPADFESRFDATERALMIAHERVHLKRRDPAVNGLVALVRCVCWFNPLAHIGAALLRVDQELACDASVTRCNPRSRRAYAEAMLKAQIEPLSLPIGCAWSHRDAVSLGLRIAMLKHHPSARQVAAGAFITAFVCLGSGCAAWASQPARAVTTAVRSFADDQLVRAALSGNVRRAEQAIREGANVNVRSRSGLTALTIAARAEDMPMLNLLLVHGADVHLVSPGEGNALVAAGRRGHLAAVAALVAHGATVNEVVPQYGTPLVAAVRTGHFAVVKYLVEHGAHVNLAFPVPAPWDRWGVMRTPLDVALRGDHALSVEYLRSVGARM
jgi:beta-lactamase regulating signal transducer with metallopeptidase domain